MNIICDHNLPYAAEAFSTLGNVRVMDGRRITHADLVSTELLIIRSTCKVTPALLDGTSVRFVGCGIIGTDHLDKSYLASRNIPWVAAPGCNAESVATYITAALLSLNCPLEGLTLGVVGVGNVGRRVVQKGQALGMRVLMSDPPRQANACDRGAQCFVDYETILRESDIITFHVPITKDGAYPTYHMLDRASLSKCKYGVVLINAARGHVVDTNSLIKAKTEGKIADLIIDCWEGEPLIPLNLLKHTLIATPHIAGHSFEGKVYGTRQVYESACQFLGVTPTYKFVLPRPPVPNITLTVEGRSDEAVLQDLVHAIYPIKADDARFRACCLGDESTRSRGFDFMRGHYPEYRREFGTTVVKIPDGSQKLRDKIAGLGFQIV